MCQFISVFQSCCLVLPSHSPSWKLQLSQHRPPPAVRSITTGIHLRRGPALNQHRCVVSPSYCCQRCSVPRSHNHNRHVVGTCYLVTCGCRTWLAANGFSCKSAWFEDVHPNIYQIQHRYLWIFMDINIYGYLWCCHNSFPSFKIIQVGSAQCLKGCGQHKSNDLFRTETALLVARLLKGWVPKAPFKIRTQKWIGHMHIAYFHK